MDNNPNNSLNPNPFGAPSPQGSPNNFTSPQSFQPGQSPQSPQSFQSNQPSQPSPSIPNQPPQPFSEESYFDAHPNQFAAQPTGTPLMSPSGNFQPTAPITPSLNKQHTPWSTLQIVIVIILSILAALAIGLFIWMFVMWNEARTDVEGKISLAEAEAIKTTTAELEANFAEQEKYPYKTFVGPIDYGELSFEYPKTWSLYIASDSSNASDYQAYLNPDAVSGTGQGAINALEVSIVNQSIDQVSQSYENSLTTGEVTISVRPINGQNATIYTGDISTGVRGIAALFKIRDKTAIVQTDAMIFSDSFYHVLDTIKFNS
ncbi:hypothetical protein IJ096_00715 [Candidatus Saccharibacteria bacterium]|nr:hypothetical protein [Candidatus Saccharibacteria bacterium]